MYAKTAHAPKIDDRETQLKKEINRARARKACHVSNSIVEIKVSRSASLLVFQALIPKLSSPGHFGPFPTPILSAILNPCVRGCWSCFAFGFA